MKKRLKKKLRKKLYGNLVVLLLVLVIIVVGYYLATHITKRIPTPAVEFDHILEPIPDKLYATTAKFLRDNPKYRAGVNINRELKQYLASFTTRNYRTAAVQIIHWQDQLNGLDLRNILAIDTVLSKSLEKAALNVRINKENIAKEEQSCGIFNGLLNPSLLVMDLTLWTGKSKIYPTLQHHNDVGKQCLIYYPQLSHGMVTYDVRTGRIVQRSAFCDPSETKSKCFGVWDYFWKFAVEPNEGPMNYGVGCSLTDWMNQGFVCTHGVDIRNNTMMMNTIFSLDGTALLHIDVKDEFQNALGASGKKIIDNVKQKCAKVKEKSSKYGSFVPTLTGAGSSLTGGVISTATAATGTGEGLKEEYEKAMLFASLFSEACVANPSDLAKDLAGGGGAGQFGLNKPNACILSAAPELGATGLKEEMQCVNHFFGPRGLEQVQNLDGLPDNRCLPSASQDSSEDEIPKAESGGCGEAGESCGRSPTDDEEDAIDSAVQNSFYQGRTEREYSYPTRIIDSDEEMLEVCGSEDGKPRVACVDTYSGVVFLPNEAVQGNQDDSLVPAEPEGYAVSRRGVIEHEYDHLDNPTLSEDEIHERDLGYGGIVPSKSNQPTPDSLEPDECSAQARKVDALAHCLEQSQMRKLLGKRGREPTPDPVPPGDEVGGTPVPTCDEARESGGAGGYFGTKENSADDCIIGDFCDFTGPMYVNGRILDKRCLYVNTNSEGFNCALGIEDS